MHIEKQGAPDKRRCRNYRKKLRKKTRKITRVTLVPDANEIITRKKTRKKYKEEYAVFCQKRRDQQRRGGGATMQQRKRDVDWTWALSYAKPKVALGLRESPRPYKNEKKPVQLDKNIHPGRRNRRRKTSGDAQIYTVMDNKGTFLVTRITKISVIGMMHCE